MADAVRICLLVVDGLIETALIFRSLFTLGCVVGDGGDQELPLFRGGPQGRFFLGIKVVCLVEADGNLL